MFLTLQHASQRKPYKTQVLINSKGHMWCGSIRSYQVFRRVISTELEGTVAAQSWEGDWKGDG